MVFHSCAWLFLRPRDCVTANGFCMPLQNISCDLFWRCLRLRNFSRSSNCLRPLKNDEFLPQHAMQHAPILKPPHIATRTPEFPVQNGTQFIAKGKASTDKHTNVEPLSSYFATQQKGKGRRAAPLTGTAWCELCKQVRKNAPKAVSSDSAGGLRSRFCRIHHRRASVQQAGGHLPV